MSIVNDCYFFYQDRGRHTATCTTLWYYYYTSEIPITHSLLIFYYYFHLFATDTNVPHQLLISRKKGYFPFDERVADP